MYQILKPVISKLSGKKYYAYSHRFHKDIPAPLLKHLSATHELEPDNKLFKVREASKTFPSDIYPGDTIVFQENSGIIEVVIPTAVFRARYVEKD